MAQLYKLRLTGVPQWAERRNRAGVSVTKTPSYHELSKAQVEAIEADQNILIEEVDEVPEGENVATSGETTTPEEEPDRLSELTNMKRKDLESVASEAGIENPGDKKAYPNIPTLAQAVVDAEAPADESTLDEAQDDEEVDEEDNPDESSVSTADETTQEDDRANAPQNPEDAADVQDDVTPPTNPTATEEDTNSNDNK